MTLPQADRDLKEFQDLNLRIYTNIIKLLENFEFSVEYTEVHRIKFLSPQKLLLL